MKKNVIFNENQEFTKFKMDLKKTALLEIFNSGNFILKFSAEENDLQKKMKKPVFTPVYSSSL